MFQSVVPIKKANISLSEKRDIMWNVLQPGDPYDIRKSMIAKLPGEKKQMSPHLELVCLLQAAEIQRLCEFLQQYKSKFRQFERVGLDRHSYEIQIKQLTQKLGQQQNYRQEIEKLRQFIRRQSTQLEQQKGKQKNEELTKKYEYSLRQLQMLIQENKQLKMSIEKLQYDYSALKFSQKSYYEQLENLREELRREKERYKKLENNSRQRENKWQEQKFMLQRQMELLKRSFQDRGQLVDEVQNKNRNISLELDKYKAEYMKFIQLQSTISEYQNRFGILASQIDRLNGILRQKSRELNEEYARSKHLKQVNKEKDEQLVSLQNQLREGQQTRSRLQKEKRQILISLGDIQRTKILIHSYELNLQKFSSQVDRLNVVLRKKVNELQENKKKNNEYEIKIRQYEINERQNNEYKMRYSEISKKISQYQKNNSQLYQENSQLNSNLKKMIEELNTSELKLKNKQKEIDNYIKTLTSQRNQLDNERNSSGKLKIQYENYANEIQSLNYSLESLKYNLSRETQNRKNLQSQVLRYADDVKNLNYTLSRRGEEIESYRKSLNENNLTIKKVDSITENNQQYIQSLINKLRQSQLKLIEAESIINNLNHENSQIKSSRSKVNDFQVLNSAKIRKYEQEIRILNNFLKNKDQELQSFKKQISQLQTKKRIMLSNPFSPEKSRKEYQNTYQDDQLDKKGSYVQRIRAFQQQLAKRQSIIIANNERIRRFEGQFDELNRNLYENTQRYENSLASLARQNKILVQKQNSRQFLLNQPNFQGLAELSEKSPQFKDIYDQLFNDRQILYNDNIIFRSQLDKLNAEIAVHYNNARQYFDQNSELKRKLQDNINDKIQVLGKEVERLNQVLFHQEENYDKKVKIFAEKERNMQSLINLYKNELGDLKSKDYGRDDQYYGQKDKKIAGLQVQNDRLTKKMRQMQQNQFSSVLSSNNDEKEGFLNKIRDYERQLQAQKSLLNSRVIQNNNISQGFSKLNLQNTELKKQISLLRTPNDKYQQKLTLSYKQIQRLNTVLKIKMQALNNLQREQQSYQSLNDKALYDLKGKYNQQVYNLSTELSQLKRQTNIQQFQNKQLNEYQYKILELSNQIQRLNKILFNNKQTIDEFQNNGSRYLKEIQRLNNTLRLKIEQEYIMNSERESSRHQQERVSSEYDELNQQHLTLHEKHVKLQEQARQYQVYLKEYQQKISQMYIEFERLQKIINNYKAQSQEGASNKRYVQELIQKNRYLAKEIERLNEIIRVSRIDLNEYKIKCTRQSALDRRIEEHLALFVVLFAQIQTLRLRSSEQEHQIQQVRREAIIQHSV